MVRSTTYKRVCRGGNRLINFCQSCNKTAYPTEDAAVRGVGVLLRNKFIPSRPYFSKKCGWWHITKQIHKQEY